MKYQEASHVNKQVWSMHFQSGGGPDFKVLNMQGKHGNPFQAL